jgi:hypothetical protein
VDFALRVVLVCFGLFWFGGSVANRLLYGDGQLKVMVVGGPNQREDHHLEFGEVWNREYQNYRFCERQGVDLCVVSWRRRCFSS